MSAIKSPPPVETTTEKQNESLWLKLLQQNTMRLVSDDSSVLILGNSLQRREVLRQLSQSDMDSNILGELELVNNSFFEVEDSSFDVPVKINIWGFQDKLVRCIPEILGPSCDAHKIAIVIALDGSLSADAIVASLKQHLQEAGALIGGLLKQMTPERIQSLRREHREYLSSVPFLKTGVKMRDVSGEDKEAVWVSSEGRFDLSNENFPLPVVVTLVQNDDLDNQRNDNRNVLSSPGSSVQEWEPLILVTNKELQGKLRLMCLEAGASLTASAMGRRNKLDETNAASLFRQYLLHRLYPNHLEAHSTPSPIDHDKDTKTSALSIVDRSSAGFFVPSGVDTVNLIEIATREKPNESVSVRAILNQTHSQQTSSSASASESAVTFQELDGEQEWLSGLHKFLSQVADTSSGLSSAGSTGIGNSSGQTGTAAHASAAGSSSTMRRAASGYGSHGSIASSSIQSEGKGIHGSNSADRLNSTGIAESSTKVAATAGSAGEKRPTAVSRKPSMIPNAGAANQNAKDFFSSLMSDSGKK